MLGFFITIVKTRRNTPAETLWKGDTVEKLENWPTTTGNTLADVIELQKKQYLDRRSSKQSVPLLVTSAQGPMASGKITRFVEIQ